MSTQQPLRGHVESSLRSPLRRVIQSKVEDRLSDAVLAEQFKAGDEVVVDYDPEIDDIVLKKKEETPESEEVSVGA